MSYAVFFYPQALEALGDAIKPYLQDSPLGAHVPCDEVDTSGSMVELTLHGRTPEGKDVALELMVPGGMVRMIVSTQSDGEFGFGPRSYERPAPGLPTIVPATAPADAEAATQATATETPPAGGDAVTPGDP